MKIALLAAALIAAPAFAQTTPMTPAQDQSAMPAPAQTAPTTPPAATPDATMTTPPATPATDPAMTTPPAAATPAPMTTDSAAPMPMANGKLPWCRAGQYTGCREHENARGQGVHRKR